MGLADGVGEEFPRSHPPRRPSARTGRHLPDRRQHVHLQVAAAGNGRQDWGEVQQARRGIIQHRRSGGAQCSLQIIEILPRSLRRRHARASSVVFLFLFPLPSSILHLRRNFPTSSELVTHRFGSHTDIGANLFRLRVDRIRLFRALKAHEVPDGSERPTIHLKPHDELVLHQGGEDGRGITGDGREDAGLDREGLPLEDPFIIGLGPQAHEEDHGERLLNRQRHERLIGEDAGMDRSDAGHLFRSLQNRCTCSGPLRSHSLGNALISSAPALPPARTRRSPVHLRPSHVFGRAGARRREPVGRRQ